MNYEVYINHVRQNASIEYVMEKALVESEHWSGSEIKPAVHAVGSFDTEVFPCPFCGAAGPTTLLISKESQLYFCPSCNEGGNVFSFVMKVMKLEFVDSVLYVADKSNLDLCLPPKESG